MKVAIVAILVCSVVAFASAAGTCGGSCTSSAACANEAGDLQCRCVNLVCSMTEPCGGGCVMDSQCKNWSGDDNCVCSWFSCTNKKNADTPGFNAFKELIMTKMSQEKREKMQAQLDLLH